MDETENPMRLSLALSFIGGFAGLFFWVLFEYLPDIFENKRVLLFLAVFAGSFFGGMLLMAGRLGIGIAARYAVAIATITALLILWSSFRFADMDRFLNTEHLFLAAFLLAHLPLSFAMSQETAPMGWRDYEGLFDHAWSIFVRSATAWMFVGLFWLVLLLSDALLDLVGFHYLGKIIKYELISIPLSGLVLGLALAVLNELTIVVSTLRRLALQLLRLLLPMVAVVVALFIGLVPFQGLDQVFGSLSAAGTMLAMAAGAVTLITSSIDAADDEAAKSTIMVISAKVLAGLLPIIAAIAVYAIWLRVGQYGWTPARLLAVVIALIVLAYALAYASSILSKDHWRGRIRQANIWLAISVTFASALWLSPILNAEKISANSHVARFLEGKIDVGGLDIWKLGDQWGIAGTTALAQIRALKEHKDQAALDDKLRRFDEGESRWSYNHSSDNGEQKGDRQRLLEILAQYSQGETIPEEALHVLPFLPVSLVPGILKGCDKVLPNGKHGCVAIVGSFQNNDEGKSISLFWRVASNDDLAIRIMEYDGKSGDYFFHRTVRYVNNARSFGQAADVINRIQDGAFEFAPINANALVINGIQIEPRR